MTPMRATRSRPLAAATIELPDAVEPSPAEVWLVEQLTTWFTAPVAPSAVLDRLRRSADTTLAYKWITRFMRLGDSSVRIVTTAMSEYPSNLRAIDRRPEVLYLAGDITSADAQAVAVVGTRQASGHATAAARSLSAELAQAGYTIISGLARGIDAASHEGALEAHGRTIAVLGTGIDVVFPEENVHIAARARSHGALVSQFPPGSPPAKDTFPARNATISGLALGSVIIDAEERSGTRIEANFSLAQGRPVFLWEPVIGRRAWARDFSVTPDVHFVGSANEIRQHLESRNRSRA